MRPSHRGSGHDAEFERLRRRLRLQVGALVLVTAVGVLGFLLIGSGAHGLIDAVYMTVITLTTVGFGEIIDLSAHPGGRLFTIALLLVGMGIVAYTVPMLAAFAIEGQFHHIFRRRRMQHRIAKLSGHFIVCGDDATSWYVAEELIQTERPTVLVTPTEAALERAVSALGDVPAVVGDPTADATLHAAGVERAAGIVCGMADDRDNILGALTARRLAAGLRIIASTANPENEDMLRTAGADAVVSPSRIGGLRMASELMRPKVVSFLDHMLRDKGGSLRVEEVTLPEGAPAVGRPLESLHVEGIAGAVLLAIRRPNAAFEFKPDRDTTLAPGMTLIVMADARGRARLEERVRGG